MTTTHCAHSARDLERRTAEFLRRSRTRLTPEEMERYAYLANDPASLQAIHQLEDKMADEVMETVECQLRGWYADGRRDGRRDARDDLEEEHAREVADLQEKIAALTAERDQLRAAAVGGTA